jgi:hypothetical protein
MGIENGNGEYSEIQLFQLLSDTSLTLLQSIAAFLECTYMYRPFDPGYMGS